MLDSLSEAVHVIGSKKCSGYEAITGLRHPRGGGQWVGNEYIKLVSIQWLMVSFFRGRVKSTIRRQARGGGSPTKPFPQEKEPHEKRIQMSVVHKAVS